MRRSKINLLCLKLNDGIKKKTIFCGGRRLAYYTTAVALSAAMLASAALPAAKADSLPVQGPFIEQLPSSNQGPLKNDVLSVIILSEEGDGDSVADRTFVFGETNGFIASFQERLIELGYLDIEETTIYYGPATREAVMYFQRQSEIEMTGDADSNTMKALFDQNAAHYSLHEGLEGEDVSSVQRQLIDLGYLVGDGAGVTGYYGTMTVEAVKKLQQSNGLETTGIIDTTTMDMMFSPEVKSTPDAEKKLRTRARILNFLEVAHSCIGKRYSIGATGPNSFDCSGLVYYCLRQAGSSRGRLNAAGYSRVSDWEKITSYSALEKGDLLFYLSRGRSRVGHVGIYIGGGMMIDASTSAGTIGKRSIYTSYYTSRFVFARRPF